MGARGVSRVWRSVHWAAPLGQEPAVGLLRRLAVDEHLGSLVFETRSSTVGTRFRVGMLPGSVKPLREYLATLTPGSTLVKEPAVHVPVDVAVDVRLSHPSLALSTDRIEAIARAALGAFAAIRQPGEELVLQVLLGARLTPQPVPGRLEQPADSWLELLTGPRPMVAADLRGHFHDRHHTHGFKVVIRLGAAAADIARARQMVTMLFSSLRVAESTGAHLRFVPIAPRLVNDTVRPVRYRMSLSIGELLGIMGWPVGADLPGMPSAHPLLVAPPKLEATKRVFGKTNAPGNNTLVGITETAARSHTLIVGPTGSAKSTGVLLPLITADIQAGRSVVVIDPKDTLITDVLGRIPEERKKDVVILDPTADVVVGVNVLRSAGRNPQQAADSLLAAFRDLFQDSWGVRTQEVLSNALLTLTQVPGATIVWLPALLTDDAFRRRVLKNIDDPLGVGRFWAKYNGMNPAARATLIAPAMTKLQQLLLRPGLRAMLGQPAPAFDLQEVFSSRKIVLIPLNRGIIGSDAARLTAGLIIASLWNLTLARVSLPEERRHYVGLYIDELASYLALSGDLSEALAEARSLGLGIHGAVQYRSQLSTETLAAFDTNALNKIVYGCGADDAQAFAKMAPNLTPEDFMLLPRFTCYCTLLSGGERTGWFSVTTLPPQPAISDPVELRAASATRYGRPVKEVEQELLATLGYMTNTASPTDDLDDEPIGRQARP